MTTHEHKHHWRAYGQQDGTVVCDDCDCADDVNQLINQARKEAAIDELEKLEEDYNIVFVADGYGGHQREEVVLIDKLHDRIQALKEGK